MSRTTHQSFMSGDAAKKLTGEERVAKEQARLHEIFQQSYPRTHCETDEHGDRKEITLHYISLVKDVKTNGNVIKLGLRPTFRVIEDRYNFINAIKETVERMFKGSFIELRRIPYSGSKFNPHQGKKECARRAKKVVA